MTSLLGLLTAFAAFFLLPAWLWIFTERLSWRFKETERKERDFWLASSTGLVVLVAWLVWKFLLPDWWRNATLELMG